MLDMEFKKPMNERKCQTWMGFEKTLSTEKIQNQYEWQATILTLSMNDIPENW